MLLQQRRVRHQVQLLAHLQWPICEVCVRVCILLAVQQRHELPARQPLPHIRRVLRIILDVQQPLARGVHLHVQLRVHIINRRQLHKHESMRIQQRRLRNKQYMHARCAWAKHVLVCVRLYIHQWFAE